MQLNTVQKKYSALYFSLFRYFPRRNPTQRNSEQYIDLYFSLFPYFARRNATQCNSEQFMFLLRALFRCFHSECNSEHYTLPFNVHFPLSYLLLNSTQHNSEQNIVLHWSLCCLLLQRATQRTLEQRIACINLRMPYSNGFQSHSSQDLNDIFSQLIQPCRDHNHRQGNGHHR